MSTRSIYISKTAPSFTLGDHQIFSNEWLLIIPRFLKNPQDRQLIPQLFDSKMTEVSSKTTILPFHTGLIHDIKDTTWQKIMETPVQGHGREREEKFKQDHKSWLETHHQETINHDIFEAQDLLNELNNTTTQTARSHTSRLFFNRNLRDEMGKKLQLRKFRTICKTLRLTHYTYPQYELIVLFYEPECIPRCSEPSCNQTHDFYAWTLQHPPLIIDKLCIT